MAFECLAGTEKVEDSSCFYVKASGVSTNSKVRFGSLSGSSGDEKLAEVTEKIAVLEVSSTAGLKKGSGDWGDLRPLLSDEVVPNWRRSITDLPAALVSEILDCLDAKELGILSCVSTSLYSIASEHHAWKEFYHERWGLPVGSLAVPGLGCPDKTSWKEMFVEREFRSKTFLGRYNIEMLRGHAEGVHSVFLLASVKLAFTGGYDSIVRMWDIEEGLCVASSRSLGCTIRAVAADTKLLVAGGTEGFIHGWRASEGVTHMFDLRGCFTQNNEFRLWGHDGPVSCLALDLSRIYSGSWDMSVCVWDRATLKLLKVLRHNDWVWGLVPHDTTIACTAGPDVYIWDTDGGNLSTLIRHAHAGETYAVARSRTGEFLFSGGQDGKIHMFEVGRRVMPDYLHVATWVPHTGHINCLAFEFPWLVSASSDGKIALIDVRKLLNSDKHSKAKKFSKVNTIDPTKVEPPQRMLHGFGGLFSVDIGADRILCGGEDGVVRIWNFEQALEIEKRAHALRHIKLENRMRRRRLQLDMNSKSSRTEQCSIAAKNSVASDGSGLWRRKPGKAAS
ncbi:hypothetical protein MLD38_004126 [Melastoma candidum]|uniref:Uncharacterized protein n=3 Tax=Melastoma candidum TaxID=119954 RepID=A0ACB9S6P1_9MYRT|nr:hypothetical protein MLD38_004126 [Melastoma candidum]